jgi:SAM-dependent methyltransferase
MHPNSLRIFEKYASGLFQENQNIKILEISPDSIPSPYFSLIENKIGVENISWETLGFSTESQNISFTHVTDNGYSYPIPDNTFDFVISSNVIEHVPKIWTWIKELQRVCKPGGYVITVNPISWHFHEAPVDCWRIYPEGMKALYEDNGLEVILGQAECVDLPSYFSSWEPSLLVPGMSYQTEFSRVKSFIKKLFRIPIVYAIDNITVGKKQQCTLLHSSQID